MQVGDGGMGGTLPRDVARLHEMAAGAEVQTRGVGDGAPDGESHEHDNDAHDAECQPDGARSHAASPPRLAAADGREPLFRAVVERLLEVGW
jgi:hypothetical protein